MIWYYINLVYSWLSIYRWNNFPRIENISESDNIAFVLHTALLVSEVLKEKEWIEIDINYIFKKILFSSFTKFVISDIDYDVKRRIKKKNINIYNTLENKIFWLLNSFDAPERFKADLNEIYSSLSLDNKLINENSHLIEDNLISFAKLWVAYQEALFNSKIYEFYYKNTINQLENTLSNDSFSIFLKYLPLNDDNNKLFSYIFIIRRLQFSYRWNKLKKVYKVSVMSHIYIVFFFSYLIGILENKTESEIVEMMKIALYHDISEAITWDIVATTKKTIPWFNELIWEIEEEMIEEYLLRYLDGYTFKEKMKQYMVSPWKLNNWNLVKIADILSALFEARMEMWNTEFQKIYKDIKKILHNNSCSSVDYLLRFWVDYFDENMDEIIKKYFNIS